MTAANIPAEPTSGLTLGPLLFHWDRDRWRDFYARIADEAPVERVCLGEVVCSKRLPFYENLLPNAIERLQRGGKTVALSSLGLITLERERKYARELVKSGLVEVEVNDLTLLDYMPEDRGFAVGPLVNVYNEGSLGYLAGRGARHVCLPPELPFAAVAALAVAAEELGVTLEVWSFGRVPLALSARCYHARIHGLSKDSCQFVCGSDPDGLSVDTLDGEPFLALNGIQTLSETYCSLIDDLTALMDVGVNSFRLSPQSCDMVKVAGLFQDVLARRIAREQALVALNALVPGARFANGFLVGSHGAELRREWG